MPRTSGPSFIATAYGPPWGGIQGGGITATGVDLRRAPHKYIIAVDPTVIPLHSQVKVWPNPFGFTGTFAAEDTGGAIKGNHIDIYDWRGRSYQLRWGRRQVSVEVVTNQAAQHASDYRQFGHSNGITRVDDGIDMTMTEGLGALGNGRVLWRDDTQWRPWGPFMSLSLDDGPRKGWHYYVAEGIMPVRHIGDRVRTGDVIAQRGLNGGNGVEGNIEAGWAGFNNPRNTLAQERGHGGQVPSPEGEDFKTFYQGIPSGSGSGSVPSLMVNTGDLSRMIDQFDWSGEIDAALIKINQESDTGYRYSQEARREILGIQTFTTTGGR